MDTDVTRRRLIWHGVLLFVFGLLTGAAVPALVTPRLALSAHLAGVLDGMFLMLLGLVWGELALSPRLAVTAFWLQVYSAYAGWAGLVLAAFFGTSETTPLAGAGHSGAPWQEGLVRITLVSFAGAILLGCGLVLYGLRRAGAATR